MPSKKTVRTKKGTKQAAITLFETNLLFPNAEQRILILKKSQYFENLNFSDAQYFQYLPKLWKVYIDIDACNKSSSKTCLNPNGLHRKFFLKGAILLDEYVMCSKQRKINKKNAFKKNLIIRGFAEKLLDLQFNKKNIDAQWDSSRKKLLNFMINMVHKKELKGFYLHGTSGVGKSYITTLFATQLAQKNYTVAYVLLPDLVTKLLKSFNEESSSFETSLNAMINSHVLVLDDVGAETYRDWFINDHFLQILNGRVNTDKITIFISNYNLDELHNHYCKIDSYKTRALSREKAATRLIDRIYELVGDNVFQLSGKSWRQHNDRKKNEDQSN